MWFTDSDLFLIKMWFTDSDFLFSEMWFTDSDLFLIEMWFTDSDFLFSIEGAQRIVARSTLFDSIARSLARL